MVRRKADCVEPNHPLAEILAVKLSGIEVVPLKEQRRMVRDTIRAGVIWARSCEGEIEKLKEILIEYGRHLPGCVGSFSSNYPCSCGWERTRKEVIDGT
ncbi:MAG: hypothetical protein ACYS30_22015 [Planctomycetota bacterium]|jgi:hypothetical protein